MLTATRQDASRLAGRDVYDNHGQKVGKLDDIYFDEQTGQAEWGLVQTGMFGRKDSFVPLTNAEEQQGAIMVGYAEDQIKQAPKIDPEGELSTAEEAQLSSYYGLEYGTQQSRTGLPQGGQPRRMPQGQPQGRQQTQGQSTTLSEEQMQVHKTSRPSELVRLKKYVVTEQSEQNVPLRREELKVERTPISEAQAGGAKIQEGEIGMTLNKEEAVVEKRVVPREQVTIGKETVTEEEKVRGEVRREEVDVEREKK